MRFVCSKFRWTGVGGSEGARLVAHLAVINVYQRACLSLSSLSVFYFDLGLFLGCRDSPLALLGYGRAEVVGNK